MRLFVYIVSLLIFGYGTLYAELKVRDITFLENSFKSGDELLDIIHSQPEKDYEPRLVKLDKILLTNYYRKNGFLTVVIRDSLRYTRQRERVDINYIIEEGQRYYYGGVRFSGAAEIGEPQLSKPFEHIEKGEPFDESHLNTARKRLEDLYYNSGKPFVRIQYDYRFENDSLVFAIFNIEENQTVYIKDIRYIGLKLVQKFLIRRELEIKKGDLYSREALEFSQQNIYSTGLFKFVRFDIDPIEGKPQNVILNVLVQEKDARWVGVQFGVAHEQDEFYGNKFDLTLQGGHRNLYGTARSVSLHITPSLWYGFETNRIINPQNRFLFQYVEPWIGATRTPGILQFAYDQKRPINFAHSNELLGSFEARHRFKKQKLDVSGSLTAKLIDRLNTGGVVDSSYTVYASLEPESRVYSVSLYGKRDSRPNLFDPRDGSMTDLSLGLSNSYVKTDADRNEANTYVTLIASWARYQPFRPTVFKKKFRWTLATRLKIGSIIDFRKNRSIPFTELFTAGGATTVRGYQQQLLGPPAKLDENGKIDEAAGGKLLFLANAEVRFPIFWLFIGEVFVDAGNVWKDINDFSPGTIRPTVGGGLALLTPLGPVRIDYGYKLVRTKKDPSPDAIHAGIYFAF